MNRPLLLALAAVSLTRAEAARAGSCGGGSSSDSGGGGSSGGDSGGFSDSDSDSGGGSAGPACADAIDIVGYRRCTKFGRWARPPRSVQAILELGTAVRTFQSPLGDATGRLAHDDESFTYRVTGRPAEASDPAAETAIVGTVRIGFPLPRGLYVAVDGEIGGLTRTTSRAEMTSTGMFGAPSITPGASVVTSGLVAAGARGETRHGTLAVEAAGVRAIFYQYQSRYLACESSATHKVSSPLLEARARASRWLSPFVHVGATVGASVLERGAWMAGVHLGVVTQPYGGMRD
jgi:hypothetical protein